MKAKKQRNKNKAINKVERKAIKVRPQIAIQ